MGPAQGLRCLSRSLHVRCFSICNNRTFITLSLTFEEIWWRRCSRFLPICTWLCFFLTQHWLLHLISFDSYLCCSNSRISLIEVVAMVTSNAGILAADQSQSQLLLSFETFLKLLWRISIEHLVVPHTLSPRSRLLAVLERMDSWVLMCVFIYALLQ